MKNKKLDDLFGKQMKVFTHMSCHYFPPFSSFIYLLSVRLQHELSCDESVSKNYISTSVPVEHSDFKFFPWNRTLCLDLIKFDKEIRSFTEYDDENTMCFGGNIKYDKEKQELADKSIPDPSDYVKYSELYDEKKGNKKHQLIFYLIDEFIRKLRDISSDLGVPFVSVVNIFNLTILYGNDGGLLYSSDTDENLEFCLNLSNSLKEEYSQYVEKYLRNKALSSQQAVEKEALSVSDLIEKISALTDNQMNSLFRILFNFSNKGEDENNPMQSSIHFTLWVVYKNLINEGSKKQMLKYLHKLHLLNISALKRNEDFYKSGKFDAHIPEEEKQDRMIKVSHDLCDLLEEVSRVLLFSEIVDQKRIELLLGNDGASDKKDILKCLQDDTFFITETVSIIQSNSYIENKYEWSKLLRYIFEEWVLKSVSKSFFMKLRGFEEGFSSVNSYFHVNDVFYDLHQLDLVREMFLRMKGDMFNDYKLTGSPIEVLTFTQARIGYICRKLKSDAGSRSSDSRQQQRILNIVNNALSSQAEKFTNIYQMSEETYEWALYKLKDNQEGVLPNYITRNKLCMRLYDTDERDRIEEKLGISLQLLSVDQIKYRLKKLVANGEINSHKPEGGRDRYIYFRNDDLEQIYRFFEVART